jgi:hypothetical protein
LAWSDTAPITWATILQANALRAFGADDEKPNRTPSAWMILLAESLALRQPLFFGWATLNEQNWSTLGERRGTAKAQVSGTAEARVCPPVPTPTNIYFLKT